VGAGRVRRSCLVVVAEIGTLIVAIPAFYFGAKSVLAGRGTE
jgi:hypothetical protein